MSGHSQVEQCEIGSKCRDRGQGFRTAEASIQPLRGGLGDARAGGGDRIRISVDGEELDIRSVEPGGMTTPPTVQSTIRRRPSARRTTSSTSTGMWNAVPLMAEKREAPHASQAGPK